MQTPHSAFWAMATLCFGVLCAYPFLRVQSNQPAQGISQEADLAVGDSARSRQAVSSEQRASSNVSSHVKMVSSGEFSTLLSPGYPRPDWESQKSDLDDLVAQGLMSSAPKADAPAFPKLPTWISQPSSLPSEKQDKIPADYDSGNLTGNSVASLTASPFERKEPSRVEQSLNRKLLDWPSESMAMAEILQAERAAKLVSGTTSPPEKFSTPKPASKSPRGKSYVFQPGHVPSLTTVSPK